MALQGNMLIGQSGGPTVVINQSLAGAVAEAKKHKAIRGIYGAAHGMKGILEESFIDLRKETAAGLEAVAATPAAALGSARKKPTPEECARVFEILKRYDIRYFFYIGGNDSAESANLIAENAKRVGYELACWHIPKTIDNDLRENDHTPGFGSAARFVAMAIMGDTLDCRAMPGVKIDVIMGRNAGFLTAATALARVQPGDGPHLIYLPERPFSFDRFAADVEAAQKKWGYCVAAVSEGIVDESGTLIAAKFSKETDSHGNAQLSGTGALGDLLAQELKARTSITRVRADTFGYLQRSFPGVVSAVDAREARQVGTAAVRAAAKGGGSGTIVIRRKPGKTYGVALVPMPLANVAKDTRRMPDAFIARAGNDVTPAFLAYAKPLAGPLPKIGRLKAVPVPRKPGGVTVSAAPREKEIVPCRPKWKGTMTDRERFNAQMHYQPFDRCFNMEFGYWEENFREWDLFVKNGITNNAEADRFFNFDRQGCLGAPVWMNPAFESKEVSRTATTRILQNDDGLLAESPLDGHDTIPHYIKASVVTPDDWKRCKEERFRRDDPARIPDYAWIERSKFENRDFPLGVWCGSMIGKIRDMLTFEGLAYACYDYPEMVEDMVETCCVLVEDMLDRLLPRATFDFAAGWEDICFKNGPIVSVDFFKNVVMPRYKRISKKLKAAGIKLWWIDCDGDVRPILPYMMEGGVNCLFPFEVNGCAHPAELLNQYGKDLRIMGGVDKIELGKGPIAIKRYLKTLVPLVERGGYIPFCDHRCPPNVKPDDYLYYLNLKEQMFGMH